MASQPTPAPNASTLAALAVQPKWENPGDNAWQVTAASLVALQSVPGLAVLYAGWVKHKWAVNSAFMAFYGFAASLIAWVCWAYKAGFGNYMLPFVGKLLCYSGNTCIVIHVLFSGRQA
jgi:ammonium transporter, Amt family